VLAPISSSSDAAEAPAEAANSTGSATRVAFHTGTAVFPTSTPVYVVSEAPATIAPMSLSAAGYVERPHKNKVGKDYPAVIRDQYPGQAQ